MEGGTLEQDWFHTIINPAWFKLSKAVGDHGTPPQGEELTLLWEDIITIKGIEQAVF